MKVLDAEINLVFPVIDGESSKFRMKILDMNDKGLLSMEAFEFIKELMERPREEPDEDLQEEIDELQDKLDRISSIAL